MDSATVGPMTRIDVVTADDIDDLVESVAGLFAEDGGRFDATMDTTWPARGGATYYRGLVGDDACLLALARDDDGRALGHLVGKQTGPDDLRLVKIAILESIRVFPHARNRGVGAALVARFFEWGRAQGWRVRDYRTGRKAARVGMLTAAVAGAVTGSVAAGVALRRRTR